ncbi:MAG: hypothetical protein M3Y08_07320 [Fibrobacterota bacterium]|nr:hypothetical protein [Fibrobacterota bacterium]
MELNREWLCICVSLIFRAVPVQGLVLSGLNVPKEKSKFMLRTTDCKRK